MTEPARDLDPVLDVLAMLRTRSPTLGEGRLVCVDGPAGSGKTTLATALAGAVPGATVLHTDDLYDGWDGLPRVSEQLLPLLADLATGRPAAHRRYDWEAGRFTEQVPVPATDLLVLDGVGSGSLDVARWCTVLVWVEAPEPLRRARALARDGDAFAPYWEAWRAAERAHFEAQGTRDRADLRIRHD